MANASILSVPANDYAEDSPTHYSLSKVPWFMSAGFNGAYLPTFTPDLGTNIEFTTNAEAGSSGYSYVFEKQYPFWPDGNGNNGGFSVHKENSPNQIRFNYKISGGNGIWMPCPIFRSISFYWKNNTTANSNFVPKHIGLVLKNWKTDQEKTWGFDGTNSATSSPIGTLYWVDTFNKVRLVRDLGPDWFVYGVIFSFQSGSTQSNQTPNSSLSDFRLGYQNDMGDGSYRMLLSVNQSWNDLKSTMNSGIIRYPNIL